MFVFRFSFDQLVPVRKTWPDAKDFGGFQDRPSL